MYLIICVLVASVLPVISSPLYYSGAIVLIAICLFLTISCTSSLFGLVMLLIYVGGVLIGSCYFTFLCFGETVNVWFLRAARSFVLGWAGSSCLYLLFFFLFLELPLELLTTYCEAGPGVDSEAGSEPASGEGSEGEDAPSVNSVGLNCLRVFCRVGLVWLSWTISWGITEVLMEWLSGFPPGPDP